MAVRQDNRVKQRDRKIEPINNPDTKSTERFSERPPETEKQILSSGFLYLLASLQKNRLIR